MRLKKKVTIATPDLYSEQELAKKIDAQLKNNEDYIHDRIILSVSGARFDGTKNEIHIYVMEDAETHPIISFEL